MPPQAGFCTSCGKEMLESSSFCTYCGGPRYAAPEGVEPKSRDGVYEIRRVGLWSLVKISFMFNAVIGLILGILIAAVGMAGLPVEMEGMNVFGESLWVGVIVVSPILYGILGALLGLVLGTLYNLLSWGVGGIRITLDQR